jgi:hypothetical protein
MTAAESSSGRSGNAGRPPTSRSRHRSGRSRRSPTPLPSPRLWRRSAASLSCSSSPSAASPCCLRWWRGWSSTITSSMSSAPDRREGDDRIALLDRQPGEADALLHSNWYCWPRRLLTSREPVTLPDLGHHDRVVADQQRAIAGPVLDAVELVLDDPAQGLEHARSRARRGAAGSRSDRRPWRCRRPLRAVRSTCPQGAVAGGRLRPRPRA